MRLKCNINKFLLFFFAFSCTKIYAQQIINNTASGDTIRIIKIIQGKTLRMITVDTATTLQTIAGNVIIKEGLTTFSCDSATINRKTNILEAFGNIHINDNDSIHTYAQYLKYVGAERIAYLKKKVKLTDKKGTLYTDDLEYNLRTGIATYKNGGRITNDKTVLTSLDGVYYADTKDVYFKNNVHLKDPDRDIWTDSLQYNLKTNIANFIAQTKIVGKDGSIINTKSGTYNLETGEAIFLDRSNFSDSTRSGVADKIAYDKKNGILQMLGNAKLVDSVNRAIVFGGEVYADTKINSFLASRKPVMILYRDGDSTYIAADTLFSGLRKYDSLERKVNTYTDTLRTTQAIKANNADSSIRYFLGFHNVRIFNDSLQAVSDSLHYSTLDSTFKLFGQPVVWNQQSQITGDTLYMFTQNQKPKRLYVFNDGMIVNRTKEGLYNQIAGRTLNGYFVDGNIDYVRIKGSPAESIYYPQDDDSAYIGMNRSSGDVIDVFFVKKEVNKVVFVNDVNGTLFPFKDIPADKKELKGFKWLDNRRPKNKLELFE
ncbi:MAG: LPS export ABC transporter periplasmic protein LptC [Ferruginibacter sp.]|nr:LPS export ABC transporter periplasmic protein LptC [Bacteroidota bacterium]MBX2919530.1 LPS export ABC transporter periplasmic protein LptC [Ferruginibacter sp.]MCB0708394.1 LPS export ABC transporter periplasmic protein LptC [Chitinophagaceae bacterium]